MSDLYRTARDDPSLAVLEGFHALKHALRFGAEIVDIALAQGAKLDQLVCELAPDLDGSIPEMTRVSPQAFQELAPRPPPTGVIAIARRVTVDVDRVVVDPGAAPIVLLEAPTHLGNIGAAIRVAAAASAAAVLTTGEHDPWHPDVIRGAAGLQYALPVARIAFLPDSDRPVIAIDPQGDPLEPGRIPERALLAFGSERRGLSEEVLARADQRLRISMRAGVSSLNLATSVAIVLYT